LFGGARGVDKASACALLRALISQLEHVPEKWTPVFRKGYAATKNLEHNPIQSNRDVL
jgi:hypothetical protein